ncbi:serine/threonine-protein phosphatase 2A regulatory subunit B'' subunit beta isoform X1 [Pteropus medius]|uniref:serine/threonine-protein phosphatase 2A regulatory subunit B'' subunit beta isoform X1 n=1 Tax=Pteropus vampyrus TaxID=132908 RepID=UPI00196B5D8E|nr:serine/threonine-protein phosphatase 2A regulatory subunit B'' subunit beta isoform X1 [Pteropus giganteus]
MPPGKVLQPVLKMKVDELFLCWLSESSTQRMLQDCLQRIKTPGRTEMGAGDAGQPGPLSAAAAPACKPSALDSQGAPSPAPASAALPLGAASSPRSGPHVRGPRRSAGTRVVSYSYFANTCKGPGEEGGAAAARQQPEHSGLLLPPRPAAGHGARGGRHRHRREDLRAVPARAGHHGGHGPSGQGVWLPPLLEGTSLLWSRRGTHRLRLRAQVYRHVEEDPAELSRRRCPVRPPAHEPRLQLPGAGGLYPLPAGRGGHAPRAGFPEGGSGLPLSLHHHSHSEDLLHGQPVLVREDHVCRAAEEHLPAGPCEVPGAPAGAAGLSRFPWQNVALLEEEADINQLTDFFSYEHFYVIYCKFWELDTDHDLLIDAQDLARHNDHAISTKMIERVFSGAVTRGRKVQKEGKISYADFVWFLISEEDKKTPTSIEYWFRCMDLDGDGALSMFELEYFYEEQCRRLDSMAIEALPFEDCLCQMLDLVKPQNEGKITLHDLKSCKLANVFFDTFFNIEKYLDHEQREQASLLRESESEGPELSDWEKYAAEEYDILVARRGEPWEDGYEAELSPVEHKLSARRSPLAQRPFFEAPSALGSVDLYDYECGDDDLPPS